MLRPAKKGDFLAIRHLINAVQINPTGLDWRRFLVAITSDGSLIGCGQIKPHSDGSLELASIAVQDEARRQGVARAVIEALLEKEPKRPMYLMCRARLKQFYVKFGFQVIGLEKMPHYFRRISSMERIFNSKAQPDDRLLVMNLD